jgi:hypothetical protein
LLDNALINLGLMPSEFWEMCFVDYLRLCIHKNLEVAREWEHTRVLYSIVLNTSVSKKSDQREPKRLMPLWTDRLEVLKRKPKKTPTQEEKEQMLNRVKNG